MEERLYAAQLGACLNEVNTAQGCDPEVSAKLQEVMLAVKGQAQTAERISDTIEAFIKRCSGATPPVHGVGSTLGAEAKSISSSHFQRIDEQLARLGKAMRALDTLSGRLGQIG